MKIHILPVAPKFQPAKTHYISPPHNADWNIERDFFRWLLDHPHLIAARPEDADWEYVPILWNALYLNWNWGQDGLDDIQHEIFRLVSRNRPTFTICEYDIQSMQPGFDLCGMVVFTGSRRDDTHQYNLDVPLLCSPHDLPAAMPEKRYLASFCGNLTTDGIRMEMQDLLAGRGDVRIERGDQGTKFFVNLMLSSHMALAPRGHGGQSFRFYEAMDLGVVPYHIGTPDTRPFKRWIDWDRCSLYAPTAQDIRLPQDTSSLAVMGWNARKTYRDHLQYGQWCRYVLRELEQL